VGKSAHGRERWVLQREIRGTADKQGKSPFMAKMQPFIRRLSALQTSEHFLPETKDGAFCM
jgi:arginine/ornithine N-succinyltransferase beta subunit